MVRAGQERVVAGEVGPAGAAERPVVLIGAASSVGIRPYDEDGRMRALDRAPAVLRALGLAELVEVDRGDVVAPEYVDFERVPGAVRNEAQVGAYGRALADEVAIALAGGAFPLVVGGDCSILLGSLLGARRLAGRIGLAYVDGHADFATPAESATGSAASMALAFAVGRGDSPLARLSAGPLVQAEDVALVGRRDEGEPYGHDALTASGILDLPGPLFARRSFRAVASTALERLTRAPLGGFWIHVDADVLDASVMPAVDSPAPGGPDVDGLFELLAPLVAQPAALGLQFTIYDPELDGDGSAGQRVVDLLGRLVAVRPISAIRA